MIHTIMTQYALKIGSRKVKKLGKTTVTKELTQLHITVNFPPITNKKTRRGGGMTNASEGKYQWRHKDT